MDQLEHNTPFKKEINGSVQKRMNALMNILSICMVEIAAERCQVSKKEHFFPILAKTHYFKTVKLVLRIVSCAPQRLAIGQILCFGKQIVELKNIHLIFFVLKLQKFDIFPKKNVFCCLAKKTNINTQNFDLKISDRCPKLLVMFC